MALTNRPLWTEGMFVRPQHFQQLDRWVGHSLERRVAGLSPYGWGVSDLAFDAALLDIGQIGLGALRAVMPDGTAVDVPADTPAPPSRPVPASAEGGLVFLTIPVDARDGAMVASDAAPGRRYTARSVAVRNVTAPERDAVDLAVAAPRLAFAFEGESLDERVALPVARIAAVEPSGRVRLSDTHIPPCLAYGASPRLATVVAEVRGLLGSRAEALVGRADPSRATAESAGLVDLLVLSAVTAAEAVFAHLAAVPTLHPEVVYRELARLVGTLSAFDAADRRPTVEPYRHDALEPTVESILTALRRRLEVVVERQAVPLPLQERGYGILTASIADRTIMQPGCRFVLAAIAATPAEQLRVQLPATVKVGAVEQIRDLVNLQLPGVPLRSLPVAPREVPYLSGAVYFELDQSTELWRSIPRSAAFAIHVSGEYPDLHLELWAIRAAKR